MSRVAELWNQLTADEKEGVFWGAQRMAGDPGAELILALARHAEAHTDPFPYVPPPETVPALPDGHQLLPWVTEEHGGKRVEWLEPQAYADRLGRQWRGPEVAGDQQQAFPTPMPVQEEP